MWNTVYGHGIFLPMQRKHLKSLFKSIRLMLDWPSLIMPARRHFWKRQAWQDFLRLLVISQSFTTGQLYSMFPETPTHQTLVIFWTKVSSVALNTSTAIYFSSGHAASGLLIKSTTLRAVTLAEWDYIYICLIKHKVHAFTQKSIGVQTEFNYWFALPHNLIIIARRRKFVFSQGRVYWWLFNTH